MTDETRKDAPEPASVLESMFMMGLGAFELGREKAGEVIDDLVERGRLSQSQAKDMAGRFGEAAERQQEVLKSAVAKETDRVLSATGVATHKDIETLQSEIAELRALIESLAARASAE